GQPAWNFYYFHGSIRVPVTAPFLLSLSPRQKASDPERKKKVNHHIVCMVNVTSHIHLQLSKDTLYQKVPSAHTHDSRAQTEPPWNKCNIPLPLPSQPTL
ncbi:unnamed protein product, partial [Ectocarpus sp. 8 AP-2014]